LDLNNPELTRIFREELEERSRRLVDGARLLIEGDLTADAVPDLIRDAHTVKGSAGLLGHGALADAGSALEKAWRAVLEERKVPSDVLVAMEATAGRLVPVLDGEPESDLRDLVERLQPTETPETAAPPVLQRVENGNLGGLLSSVSEDLLSGATRVDTGHLYRLINRIVEVSLDADALSDISLVSIEGADPDLFRKSWRAQLAKLSDSIAEIQEQAIALANVSFFEAVSTYPQFIRYLGRRMGKDVRILIEGEDVQLDRQIVDLLREPLRHLLVNAVDHGIETPAERIAVGKPATGTITVRAERTPERVEVSVIDDGVGIDWSRVADVARERGIPVTHPDISPVLFESGFTTLPEVAEFSGTGEGLAAAVAAVESANGAIHVASVRGTGTTVTLVLPLSMALQNVVVVASGDQFWGIPEAAVEASMPLSKAETTSTASGRSVQFKSGAIPCVSLGAAMGDDDTEDESELLVVTTRSGLVAVTVGELVDLRRVAVKNLGPILEGAGQVTGAALLGGGQFLVVIDPNFLGMIARQRPRKAEDNPRILVVDDSAGVRQLLSATLTGAGFDVEVASNAREAAVAMAGNGFDAMVVDYSMPRSNGVELVRAMRAAEVRVPIVMVSGVATPQEKQAAWEVGVDAYLDKFDLRQGVLTKTLYQLLGLENAETA
jgi:two-component system, chemotaxis family, sensor kinase CheA